MSAQPLEARIASLEGSYRQVSDRLNSIDRRLDGFEQKVEGRFNTLDARIDSVQWRVAALILVSWITLMSAILLRH
ncbi:MAG: hypothetical protein WCB99_05245 [Candidatus Cybelea sp.]